MRRLLLMVTTVMVILIGGVLFTASLNAPQTGKRLSLQQYDLQLQLLPLLNDARLRPALEQFDTDALVSKSAGAYREVISSLGRTKLADSRERLAEYRLRLGLLLADQDKTDQALATWGRVDGDERDLARVLGGLWQTPPRLLPGAEPLIDRRLTGWYRSTALARLYDVQNRDQAAAHLAQTDRERALAVLGRLVLISAMPLAGLVLGVVVLVGWWLWRRNLPDPPAWQVPWTLTTVWEVVVFWMASYLSLSLVVSSLRSGLGIDPTDPLGIALVNLLTYGLLAGAGLLLLVGLVLRPYKREERAHLFRYDLVAGWWKWAVGGWLAGFPAVLCAALVSQGLIGDRGGGNPLLESIGGADTLAAQALLFAALAVAAPLFEETFFRGFVLPSLASRFPFPAAVAASSALFAIAHWSAIEFLPLFALGIILAVVYHHTRSLTPGIVLHSLWNAGTFVTLLLLAGS